MSERAAQVLREALDLSIEERAKLAKELLGSLDELDEDAEQKWATEVEDRARRAIAGDSVGVDWETVRDRTLSKISQ